MTGRKHHGLMMLKIPWDSISSHACFFNVSFPLQISPLYAIISSDFEVNDINFYQCIKGMKSDNVFVVGLTH